MAFELFKNDAESTLDGAIDGSQTTLDVQSAADFPTTGNFRIRIDDEIMLVTGVSGQTFTVTRGHETAAASHASGARVVHVLTEGSFDARISNRIVRGTYASRPSAGVKGRLFIPSDGFFLEYDDGSAWRQYGMLNSFVEPPTLGWTTVNAVGVNVTHTTKGFARITKAPLGGAAANDYRFYARTAPTPPYTVTAGFLLNGPKSDFFVAGLALRNSATDDFRLFALQNLKDTAGTAIISYRYTDNTTFSANGFAGTGIRVFPFHVLWLRIEDDNTNHKMSISYDGVNFILLNTEGRTTFTTPDQICVTYDIRNNQREVVVPLVHWQEA